MISQHTSGITSCHLKENPNSRDTLFMSVYHAFSTFRHENPESMQQVNDSLNTHIQKINEAPCNSAERYQHISEFVAIMVLETIQIPPHLIEQYINTIFDNETTIEGKGQVIYALCEGARCCQNQALNDHINTILLSWAKKEHHVARYTLHALIEANKNSHETGNQHHFVDHSIKLIQSIALLNETIHKEAMRTLVKLATQTSGEQRAAIIDYLYSLDDPSHAENAFAALPREDRKSEQERVIKSLPQNRNEAPLRVLLQELRMTILSGILDSDESIESLQRSLTPIIQTMNAETGNRSKRQHVIVTLIYTITNLMKGIETIPPLPLYLEHTLSIMFRNQDSIEDKKEVMDSICLAAAVCGNKAYQDQITHHLRSWTQTDHRLIPHLLHALIHTHEVVSEKHAQNHFLDHSIQMIRSFAITTNDHQAAARQALATLATQTSGEHRSAVINAMYTLENPLLAFRTIYSLPNEAKESELQRLIELSHREQTDPKPHTALLNSLIKIVSKTDHFKPAETLINALKKYPHHPTTATRMASLLTAHPTMDVQPLMAILYQDAGHHEAFDSVMSVIKASQDTSLLLRIDAELINRPPEYRSKAEAMLNRLNSITDSNLILAAATLKFSNNIPSIHQIVNPSNEDAAFFHECMRLIFDTTPARQSNQEMIQAIETQLGVEPISTNEYRDVSILAKIKDQETYDFDGLTKWLTLNRTSPMTRETTHLSDRKLAHYPMLMWRLLHTTPSHSLQRLCTIWDGLPNGSSLKKDHHLSNMMTVIKSYQP